MSKPHDLIKRQVAICGHIDDDDRSCEMFLRECTAGARLQILLKRDCAGLVAEFKRHDETPWTELARVHRTTGVMHRHSRADIRRETGVIPTWVNRAAEHVHHV